MLPSGSSAQDLRIAEVSLDLLHFDKTVQVLQTGPDLPPEICAVTLGMATPPFTVPDPVDYLEVVHVDHDRACGDP